MEDYQPVPVEAAKTLAAAFGKDVVVVLAVDHEHGLTHFTTYGKDALDKVDAAALGDTVRKSLGIADEAVGWFEDFRRASGGVDLIAAARRERFEDGHTPARDMADYPDGQLAAAAACYALLQGVEAMRPELAMTIPTWINDVWPQGCEWDPKDPIRNLARAGALLAAEIDRLSSADRG